jgi:hypothetical protein
MENRLWTLLPIEIALIIIVALGGLTLVTEVSTTEGGKAGLPHEPYPYTDLSIESKFNEGKSEPFRLLAAFDFFGSGEISFENSSLKYKSLKWSWLVTRTRIQDVVNAQWLWKAIGGKEFIIEAWNAYPNNTGRTAMIIFRDGKVYQVQYPDDVYLMDFNPFNGLVTVRMTIDYDVPEIRSLWINEHHFSQLRIGNEPIGTTPPFWQMQIFLRGDSTVLVKEMRAWK